MLLSSAALYLALLTHYSAMIFAVVIGVYGVLTLVRKRWPAKLTIAWIIAQAGALAVCIFLYESQISKLRQSGVPSEIAATWLKGSIFQPGHNHLVTFAWSNTLRLFRYFFSHGTVGVIGFALFVFAIVSLILLDKNSEPKSHNRELAILLAAPLVVTLILAIAGVYPYGGTRHDALLAVFAISGISIGLDRLPLRPHGTSAQITKAVLLASALLICNLFPAPSGPYMRPHNQRQELMHQAIGSIKSIPSESVIFTDFQGGLVLNYYLCDDAMPLPFTPEKQILKMRCGQDYVLTSMAAQTGFDRTIFPELLSEARQENPEDTPLYLFQSGWIDDQEEDWQTELRELGGNPRNFGQNILLCPFPPISHSQQPAP
jgi:hypothetical protein